MDTTENRILHINIFHTSAAICSTFTDRDMIVEEARGIKLECEKVQMKAGERWWHRRKPEAGGLM